MLVAVVAGARRLALDGKELGDDSNALDRDAIAGMRGLDDHDDWPY